MRILLLSREPEGKTLCLKLQSLGHQVELITHEDIKKSFNPDVVISHHFPFIITGEQLEYVKKYVKLNFHNTYLPYGRGIYGIMWAAAMNCPQGFTFHCLERKLDGGAILHRRKIEFLEKFTLRQVWAEIENTSIDFLINELSNLKFLYNNRYYDESIEGFIKTRKESMVLFNLLSKGWDSTIEETRDIFRSRISA